MCWSFARSLFSLSLQLHEVNGIIPIFQTSSEKFNKLRGYLEMSYPLPCLPAAGLELREGRSWTPLIPQTLSLHATQEEAVA